MNVMKVWTPARITNDCPVLHFPFNANRPSGTLCGFFSVKRKLFKLGSGLKQLFSLLCFPFHFRDSHSITALQNGTLFPEELHEFHPKGEARAGGTDPDGMAALPMPPIWTALLGRNNLVVALLYSFLQRREECSRF
jgi:hypothetical protein